MKAADFKPGMIVRVNKGLLTILDILHGDNGYHLYVKCSGPFDEAGATFLFHKDDEIELVKGPFRVRTEEESRPWGKPTVTIHYKGDSLAEAKSAFLGIVATPVKTDSRLTYIEERLPSGHWRSVRWNGQGKPS